MNNWDDSTPAADMFMRDPGYLDHPQRVWLRGFLRDQLKQQPALKLLDLGCGTGITLENIETAGLLPQIHYTGVDGCQKFISYCRQRWPDRRDTFEIADLCAYRSRQRFEIVILSHVLEHNDDYEAVLQSARAAGKLVVVLFFSELRDEPTHNMRLCPPPWVDIPNNQYSKTLIERTMSKFGSLSPVPVPNASPRDSVYLIKCVSQKTAHAC